MLTLVLNSEFLVIIFFCLYTIVGVLYNVNITLGIALIFIILSGLEVSLSILVLVFYVKNKIKKSMKMEQNSLKKKEKKFNKNFNQLFCVYNAIRSL